MPPKKQQQDDSADALGQILDNAFTGEEFTSALAQVEAELGIEGNEGAIKLFVSKIIPDGRAARLWEGTPAEYNLREIAVRHGSGDYEVMMYGPRPDGRYSRRARRVIPVILDPAEERALKMEREGVPLAAQAGPAITSESLAVAIAAAIKAAMPPPAPPANPLGTLREVAGVLRDLIPQPRAEGGGTLETIRMALALAKDFGGNRAAGNGDHETSGLDLLNNLIDKFAPAIQDAMLKPGAQQSGTASQAVPPAAIINQSEGQPMQPDQQQQANALVQGLSFLNMQAKRNADPELYADMILDNVDDAVIDAFMQRPDWLEYLCAFNADVRQFAPWYERLRAEIAEAIKPEDAPGDVQPPPAAA